VTARGANGPGVAWVCGRRLVAYAGVMPNDLGSSGQIAVQPDMKPGGLKKGDLKPGDLEDDVVTGIRGLIIGVVDKCRGKLLWILDRGKVRKHEWDDRGLTPPPHNDDPSHPV
jgi:hypothetical protein